MTASSCKGPVFDPSPHRAACKHLEQVVFWSLQAPDKHGVCGRECKQNNYAFENKYMHTQIRKKSPFIFTAISIFFIYKYFYSLELIITSGSVIDS